MTATAELANLDFTIPGLFLEEDLQLDVGVPPVRAAPPQHTVVTDTQATCLTEDAHFLLMLTTQSDSEMWREKCVNFCSYSTNFAATNIILIVNVQQILYNLLWPLKHYCAIIIPFFEFLTSLQRVGR